MEFRSIRGVRILRHLPWQQLCPEVRSQRPLEAAGADIRARLNVLFVGLVRLARVESSWVPPRRFLGMGVPLGAGLPLGFPVGLPSGPPWASLPPLCSGSPLDFQTERRRLRVKTG